MDWTGLYRETVSRVDAAAGYYNHNVRIDLPAGPVLVRIPIRGADVMDLRIWREEAVLAAIAPHVRQVPRMMFSSADPPFQVHEFIAGELLNEIAPRGTPSPPHVMADTVRLLRQLIGVPREALPATPPGWPSDGDSAGFARQLSDLTESVFQACREQYAELFDRFAIPADPLGRIRESWSSLTPRPHGCVHADIHRKNVIVKGGTSFFLDWELALWGDPVYDLAVHLHKMSYAPDEHREFLAGWSSAMPREHTAGWADDLDAYLGHEQVKSAIVDTVRYARLFAGGGPYPYPEHQMVDMMTAKLNAARRHWRIPSRIARAEVGSALRRWASAC